MKRDEFFFPSNGIQHWSSAHQALIHHHQQANWQPPVPLWPMPEPNFSHLNDLPMPLFNRGADIPVRIERQPLSEEEKRKDRRFLLIVGGVMLCFIPPLSLIGLLVLSYYGATRLFGRS